MKRSLLMFSIFLIGLKPGLIAQNESEGVFLSARDFTNGKIAFANKHSGKKYQLRLNEFFNAASIKILIGDSMITFAKDSIYGYHDKNGKSYRFYRKTVFEILNPSEKILLYSTTSGTGSPRNRAQVTNYYFSESAGSPIYPLTKRYLEIVYSKDVQFEELLDIYFHNDDELTSYDGINKIYFLNRIYEESRLESVQKHYKINEYESKCSIFNNSSN
ncbi:MAG: hypothetical protein NTY96_04715 [Bacteroidetes bacterium]|nr:hypothetical protein [Bacteroidota bacterium]